MILDELLEFADAVDAYNAQSEKLVGDVIDLGATTNYPGEGEPMYLVILVSTAFVGATSTTKFKLLSDAQAAIAVDGSATEHWASAAIGVATLVAGYKVCCIALPSGAYERYLGVTAVSATANTTAGAINAFLTKDPARFGVENLPDAI